MQTTSSRTSVSEGQAVTANDVQAIRNDIEIPADDARSLAEHRPRRTNRLPARYRDMLPQAPPLPIAVPDSIPGSSAEPSESPSLRGSPLGSALLARTLRFFTTLANSFGLSRRYYGDRLLNHDLEDATTLHHLTLTSPATEDRVSDEGQVSQLFHPYPNKSSFLLGDWYWNGGIQKSKESFKKLIKIVGNPNFRPEHVNGTRWDFINAQLQADAEETGPDQPFEGAGWTKTAITIKVPFHKRTPKPGVYDYHVGDMYHCTLISVIREKLANAQHDELFHYQPYNLFWQRKESPTPINVYGELYTSEAFLKAHRNLQQSPSEPGCDRERVIVALMFWSDATQLTSFGNAKLWPCYMFFGNESKYRRCKPSSCLCNHVAYFNHVRTCDRQLLETSVTSTISSSQMHQQTRHHLARVGQDWPDDQLFQKGTYLARTGQSLPRVPNN